MNCAASLASQRPMKLEGIVWSGRRIKTGRKRGSKRARVVFHRPAFSQIILGTHSRIKTGHAPHLFKRSRHATF